MDQDSTVPSAVWEAYGPTSLKLAYGASRSGVNIFHNARCKVQPTVELIVKKGILGQFRKLFCAYYSSSRFYFCTNDIGFILKDISGKELVKKLFKIQDRRARQFFGYVI